MNHWSNDFEITSFIWDHIWPEIFYFLPQEKSEFFSNPSFLAQTYVCSRVIHFFEAKCGLIWLASNFIGSIALRSRKFSMQTQKH